MKLRAYTITGASYDIEVDDDFTPGDVDGFPGPIEVGGVLCLPAVYELHEDEKPTGHYREAWVALKTIVAFEHVRG